METLALYAGLFALVGGLIWALAWSAGQRKKEKARADILDDQAKRRGKGDEERAEPLPLGPRLAASWRRYKRLREESRG
jgi:hypothetical protein